MTNKKVLKLLTEEESEKDKDEEDPERGDHHVTML
jgi:hypothetical protein